MNMTLLAVTFLPLVGALVLLLMDNQPSRRNPAVLRWTALGFSVFTFLLSLPLLLTFQTGAGFGSGDMSFVTDVLWIIPWGIHFHIGVDGISLPLILLTTFLTPLALLSGWTSIEKRQKEFLILMLLLETGMLGVFVALDLFLFYLFWEFTLIPMILLIGIWGSDRRVYAAIKFFLYTAVGSLLMLIAILALVVIHANQTGQYTFDLLALKAGLKLDPAAQIWLFLAFFLAFAIKVPLWPLHTWLPDAHTEAPTPGSVILAGVLLKLGGYGMLRYNLGLFPDAARTLAPAIAILAIIGIIYGALVSFAQKDLKRLVAYSSVSHMGFVVLGIFSLNPLGISGAVLQMVNHGLSTGALFMLVGVIYERRHTRLLSEFGGLGISMPIYAALMLIITLSSLAVPGLNGFIGEFAILQGAFATNWIYAAFATVGMILAAVYLLWMYQQIFTGEIKNPANAAVRDLNRREIWSLVPIVIMVFVLGLYPALFLNIIVPAAQSLASQVIQHAALTLQFPFLP
ncbi:MAG: NADH-quinone oxidoreductase subunit M [Chloroflexi bacterium]|nr:NADH-quinone oxidoreductase subunit M [Chloroflexota bacterium]